MKKILFAASVFALVGTAAYAGNGEKDKKAKNKQECVKPAEKKGCCASSSSCKKPASAPAEKAK